MKKIFFAAISVFWLPLAAAAGEISPGAVPGSINYQGRLEHDNAPITGTVHIYFRIYNAPTGPNTLRWSSPLISAEAAQGIFSANITPSMDVFSRAEKLYLEVQVESEILTPREPLSSVAYALVAKKLEDGATISVSTLTVAYQVLLATTPGASVGIGTPNPTNKLTVNGSIQLLNLGSLIFPDGSVMTASSVGSASNISTFGDATIVSDSDNNGLGDMIFSNPSREQARILNNGNMGIGTPMPGGKLDVNGSLYVGEGIHGYGPSGDLNIIANVIVSSGRVTGKGLNYISIGEATPDTIIAATNNTPHVWIDPSGEVGIGLAAPTSKLHVAGDIHATTGLRGGAVSVGGYTGWATSANEIRAADNSDLLLQNSNSYNVGIGTDTPREKLHVHGSVMADNGIIAATAAYSGAVTVNGDLVANHDFYANGNNRNVYLTSTTIYGTLSVSGGIGSTAGLPAYVGSTQTLTGLNTFLHQVTVSSDILTVNRIGAGVVDFDFPASKYLQVGDNQGAFANDDANIYLVGGSAANAKINFYRGIAESARLETEGGKNLALVINNSTKTLTDAIYHRIQNSVVWISTGFNTTPAIFVSSKDGNVGIGTVVADSAYRMTLDGMLHITGAGNGIVFPNGSFISSSTASSADSIANSGDAVVMANTGGGGGNAVLQSGPVVGLVSDPSGFVGIGIENPTSRLDVRNGDLVIGNPVNPYSGDGVDDLIVGGKIVFDGALIQRSVSAAQFSALIVAGDVYLSTGTGAKTGIGTSTPLSALAVNGGLHVGGDSDAGDNNILADGTINGSNLSGTNTGDQTITLQQDVTGTGVGTFNTTIAAGAVTLGKMATLAANSIIGNNTGAGATPLALSVAQVKTLLSLNNVENTALSTWGGSTSLNTFANNAVSLTNMANMPTASLIYRKTGGAGAPEVNTLATLKTDLGLSGTNSGDNAVNTTYASDYRAANFVAGADYLPVTGGSAGHVICWKTATTLSYCTSLVDGSGNCTCF